MPPTAFSVEPRPDARICIRLPEALLREVSELAAAHGAHVAPTIRALVRTGLDVATSGNRG